MSASRGEPKHARPRGDTLGRAAAPVRLVTVAALATITWLAPACAPAAPKVGELRVVLTDLAAGPWTGAFELVAESNAPEWRFRGTVEDGSEMELRGVPIGEIRLRVVSRDPARNHRFDALLWIEEGPNEATVTMTPGGSVTGRVLGPDGAPIADAEVGLRTLHFDPPPPGPDATLDADAIAAAPSTLREDEATVRTESDGRFTFDWTRPGAKEVVVGDAPPRAVLVEADRAVDLGEIVAN